MYLIRVRRSDSIRSIDKLQWCCIISGHWIRTTQCGLIQSVAKITKAQFTAICDGIRADREIIIEHNPIGTPEETQLWMLLNILVNYLSLDESETPCFTGIPDRETYRKAIDHVIKNKKAEKFDVDPIIDGMLNL